MTSSLFTYMWLSTIWVAVSIVLTSGAHPTTGTVALCLWMLHRRWEKKELKTRLEKLAPRAE